MEPRSPVSAEAPTNGPGYAEIARAYGAEGIRITSADELLPALQGGHRQRQADRVGCADDQQPNAHDRALEHSRHLFAR